jgi:heme exporter protein A
MESSGADAPPVEVQGLSKSFGPQVALSGVDATISRGETVALLGPNGAGKTTLIRLIAGLSRPTGGRVLVEGVDLSKRPDLVRRRIGVISHQTMLYDDLTAAENLRFYGRLYGLDDVERRVAAALDAVGLSPRAADRFRTFSRGMKQRLAIARATLHDPALLLLDEPFTGLDAGGQAALADRIRGFHRDGRTAILVTHDLAQAVGLAGRFVLLVRGRLRDAGSCKGLSPSDLEARYAAATG